MASDARPRTRLLSDARSRGSPPPVRNENEAGPLREELEALVRYYHHLQNEHRRAAHEGRVRRRIEDRVLDVRERFDRLLDEWVRDPDLAQEWRDHLDSRAPAPAGPPAIEPPLFKGENEAGAVAEIRRKGDELAVTIDGKLAERLHVKDFPSDWQPGVFRVSNTTFTETFDASAAALRALADYLGEGDGQSPPWEYAAELLADGLIDVHFALTPRGRRALRMTLR